jgi:hypothetical protein
VTLIASLLPNDFRDVVENGGCHGLVPRHFAVFDQALDGPVTASRAHLWVLDRGSPRIRLQV